MVGCTCHVGVATQAGSVRTRNGDTLNRTPLADMWLIPQYKIKQVLACRISRNKHMIEISSEVFVVGPTRAQSYARAHVLRED